MPELPKKGRNKFVFKLLLGLGLLALLLFLVDFKEVWKALAKLNPWYLLPVAVLFYLDRGLMAYKWRPLLQALNVRVPLFALIRIYLTASVAGIFLLTNYGGDVFRVYSLSRYRVDVKEVLASIVVERVIGFLCMMAFAAISLGIAFFLLKDSRAQFGGVLLLWVGGAIIVTVVVTGILVFFTKWIGKLSGLLSRFSYLEKLIRIFTISYELRTRHRTLAIVSAWTFLEQMFPIIATFLIVRALNIDAPFLELMAIIPLIVFILRMPITFEGFGVQEGLYIGLFGLLDVSVGEALVLSSVTRVVYLLCALPWGIHYFFSSRQNALPQEPTASAA